MYCVSLLLQLAAGDRKKSTWTALRSFFVALIRFVGASHFGFQALDLKTYAMAYMGTKFKETTKRTMPEEWFANSGKHTHIAIDDAIEQGYLFFNIKESLEQLRKEC